MGGAERGAVVGGVIVCPLGGDGEVGEESGRSGSGGGESQGDGRVRSSGLAQGGGDGNSGGVGPFVQGEDIHGQASLARGLLGGHGSGGQQKQEEQQSCRYQSAISILLRFCGRDERPWCAVDKKYGRSEGAQIVHDGLPPNLDFSVVRLI